VDVRDDVTELLAGFSLFADLSSTERERVAHTFKEAWFAEGERILRQGISGGSAFYVILEGSAGIRVDGVERWSLKPGEFFGEISSLLGEVAVADIMALTPLRCLVLDGDQLESFLVSHPKVMYRVLQGEARKVRNTTQWQN